MIKRKYPAVAPVLAYSLVCVLTVLFTGSQAQAQLRPSLEYAQFPSLISCIRIEGPIDFCGEPVPLDNPEVRERLEKEILLNLWDRAQMILYLKRTGRYFPYVEEMLRMQDMPDDLKYIAVIESALRPHVGSSAGAVGYWQFIRSTGLKYGLRIDSEIDERRSIYTSTKAALDYLTVLEDLFGSWTMAVSAYNMGETGLRKRVRHQETSDYYNLQLPTETMRYVYRAIAVKIILSDPARYGFNMLESDYYQPREFDRVTITSKRKVPLMLIAKSADTYFKTIKDLNPHILGDNLPSGTNTVLVPKGSGTGFHARYDELSKKYKPEPSQKKTYVVRKGDTLIGIARKQGLSLNQLLNLNRLTTRSRIYPGQRLVISN